MCDKQSQKHKRMVQTKRETEKHGDTITDHSQQLL